MNRQLVKPIVVVDIETTGLNVDFDQIHEIALIWSRGPEPVVYQAFLEVDLESMNPVAREMYELGKAMREPNQAAEKVAAEVAQLTRGGVMVGNNPQFDLKFLARFTRQNGWVEGWHYQAEDVEARAAQYLGAGPPPWDSSELSAGLGVDRNLYLAHSAIGDARWSLDQYEKLTGLDLGSRLLGNLGMRAGLEAPKNGPELQSERREL